MQFTEEQILISDMAAKLCVDEIAPKAGVRDKEKTFPKGELDALFEAGLMGMMVDPKYGGSGTDQLSQTLVIEHIARHNAGLSTIVCVHAMVCGILSDYASEEQKEKFLKPLTKDSVAAFALTEAGAGSDASAIRTTAVKDGDDYIINGTKQFITSGKIGKIAIVFAVTDKNAGKKGISAFIVPTNTKGYSAPHIEEKMGQHCSDTAQLVFEDMRIPSENMIGKEGDGYKLALANLESGRISIAAQSLGLARAAYTEAIGYSKERKTFGKAIIEHQAVGFKLVDMKTKMVAASHMVYEAAAMRDAKKPCLEQACMAKLYTSEVAEEIAKDAIQIHGGYGYLCDFPIERIYRDGRVCSIYEGTSDIQKLIILKEITKNVQRL